VETTGGTSQDGTSRTGIGQEADAGGTNQDGIYHHDRQPEEIGGTSQDGTSQTGTTGLISQVVWVMPYSQHLSITMWPLISNK